MEIYRAELNEIRPNVPTVRQAEKKHGSYRNIVNSEAYNAWHYILVYYSSWYRLSAPL